MLNLTALVKVRALRRSPTLNNYLSASKIATHEFIDILAKGTVADLQNPALLFLYRRSGGDAICDLYLSTKCQYKNQPCRSETTGVFQEREWLKPKRFYLVLQPGYGPYRHRLISDTLLTGITLNINGALPCPV
jgi:hypothetical protein